MPQQPLRHPAGASPPARRRNHPVKRFSPLSVLVDRE
jgi:hypothetical protein